MLKSPPATLPLANSMSESTRNRRGFQGILLATVAAGIAGYVVTWIVFRFAGSEDYAHFAVFWSAFFLLVGGFAGVQQEYSRATTEIDAQPARSDRRATGWKFAVVLAGLVVAIVIVSSPLWMPTLFRVDWMMWAWPFVAGTAATIIMSATAGSLYGIGSWKLIAAMIAVDAFIRLAAVATVLVLEAPVEVYGWAIVAPIPLTLIVALPWLIRALRNQTKVDTTSRRLSWNVGRTVIASLATGVLVSGFPAVLQSSSPNVESAVLGDMIFAVTLARAPLIVTVMALQSFLVVQFRNNPDGKRRLLVRIGTILVASTIAASVLCIVIGEPLLNFVAGRTVVNGSLFTVGLVVSSGLVALLQVTGSYLVSESRHSAYSLGLVLAAISTVALLEVDLTLIGRVTLSLIGAPALGLLSHAAAILMRRVTTRA